MLFRKTLLHAYQEPTGYIVSFTYKEGDDLRGGFVQEVEIPVVPADKQVDITPDFVERKFNFHIKDIQKPYDDQITSLKSEINTLKFVIDDLILFGGGF